MQFSFGNHYLWLLDIYMYNGSPQKIVSEYDQEIQQSQTADKPVAS